MTERILTPCVPFNEWWQKFGHHLAGSITPHELAYSAWLGGKQSASSEMAPLTAGELDALIDYHDWNSAAAEAVEMIESSEYHDKRAKSFQAMRDAMPKEKK